MVRLIWWEGVKRVQWCHDTGHVEDIKCAAGLKSCRWRQTVTWTGWTAGDRVLERQSFLLWKSETCWRKDEMTEKEVPGKRNKMDEFMAFEKVMHFFFIIWLIRLLLVIIIYHTSIVISYHTNGKLYYMYKLYYFIVWHFCPPQNCIY